MSRIARLAYRRPVNAADVQTLMKFYEEGRRDGGTFEAGVQFALERMLVDPDFLLRVYRDPGSSSRAPACSLPASALSPVRTRAGLPTVLLPLVQHPRRRAPDACRATEVERSGGARAAGEAHARRSALERSARQRLRRAMAESPPRGRGRGRSGALSELRPHADGGVQARDRALCRQHAARGSERGRAARTRTIRSSTRSSPGTTAFLEFTAAGSGASRCQTRTSAGGCWRRARCYRRPHIPIARRRFFAGNFC